MGPLLDMQVHWIYTCIYVHMHKCAIMIIFIMINPAIFVWSRTHYFSSHLINMLNPIYIYVRSITWVTTQLYSSGVDMYIYTLMLHGKRIWMPKRRWWRHFQHTTHFRILYILLSILSSHFILLRRFNFAKCLIQYIYIYIYIYIGKHGKDNCDVTKYSMIWRHAI